MLLPISYRPFLLVALFSLPSLLMQVPSVLSSSEPTTPEPPPRDSPRICPLPKCKRCPTAEEILAPGVGFALEMGYGTAAVRLHDGSYQTIVRIDGTPSYTSLLRRLATGPQNRIPHDIPSTREKLRYLQKRAQRILNKSLGRPATPETAILADLISKLKIKTEAALGNGQQVTAAVLSSPDRIRLTDEEINDVFDYLGIRSLMANPDWPLDDLYATSSAYAGFGQGLCERYTDPYACELEEDRFPTQRLLHLDFAHASLSGTIMSLKSANDGSVDESFIDPELGLGRLEDRLNKETGLESEGEERASYWAAVTNRIRTLVQSYRPRITQLILTGSSASDARFKIAVKDALRDLVAEGPLRMLNDGKERKDRIVDLVFATAKGAAEFAKRRQEGPVRCVETEECKRVRKGLEQEETEATEL